ncbi:MAG: nucleoside deaminase [Actinobacteria bacterium]|nr:nucleoside deaminase [Actinomycetota bacterium]
MIPVTDEEAMDIAMAQARAGGAAGEIPIGAVVVDGDGRIVARAHNSRETLRDPTAHAEVLALREAATALGRWRLDDCTMVVTLEPCPMCAGAVVMSRVRRLIFGAWNEEYGAAGSRWDLVRDRRLNHRSEVIGGLRADECGAMVTEFMVSQRVAAEE